MQNFCPNIELKRSIYRRFSIVIPLKHAQKTTQRRKKGSRTTGGFMLIRIFNVYKKSGNWHGFEPYTFRLSVINLTNYAVTTRLYTTVSHNRFYCINKYISDLELLRSRKNQKVEHEKFSWKLRVFKNGAQSVQLKFCRRTHVYNKNFKISSGTIKKYVVPRTVNPPSGPA